MSLFPDLPEVELIEEELDPSLPSSEKWTYMFDFSTRRLMVDANGRPLKTSSYEEYLVQVASKIINTERFYYPIYDEVIGVEKSEWSNWEDTDISDDIKEALEAHSEIEVAEVREIIRETDKMRLVIFIQGLSGDVETEVNVYAA
jgi:hypothetical protein